jgi:hypothetical protein
MYNIEPKQAAEKMCVCVCFNFYITSRASESVNYVKGTTTHTGACLDLCTHVHVNRRSHFISFRSARSEEREVAAPPRENIEQQQQQKT